jgi:hypothetical protein
MKTSTSRRSRPAVLQRARWSAYAAAGAATALTGLGSAEAEIHYSGIINQQVKGRPFHPARVAFQLDQPGDSFVLRHVLSSSGVVGYAGVSMHGVGTRARFGGFVHTIPYYGGPVSYASKLSFGQNVATVPQVFLAGGRNFQSANMAIGEVQRRYQWSKRGEGFLALQFDSGQGVQYGWARIKISGPFAHYMTVMDYAWGDPGDTVLAGDSGQGAVPQVPFSGSLGWLALGGAGLLAWRRARTPTASLGKAGSPSPSS